MLPPASLMQRRWAMLLRLLFVVNAFMVPIELCFYQQSLRVRVRCLASGPPCHAAGTRPVPRVSS